MTERCGNEATVASFSACVYNNKLLDVLTVLQACYQVVRLQECANMLTLHVTLAACIFVTQNQGTEGWAYICADDKTRNVSRFIAK